VVEERAHCLDRLAGVAPELARRCLSIGGVSDLKDAWDALQAMTPSGCYVGKPSYHDERDEWLLYAFDPSERAVVGVRSREWTAVASTEVGVVREMARCLQGHR
jgi:hypothetical protein